MYGYQIFGIRYPSGFIERLFVLDTDNPIPELKQYLIFLIQEYMMETDELLTPFGKKLKEDIHALFKE